MMELIEYYDKQLTYESFLPLLNVAIVSEVFTFHKYSIVSLYNSVLHILFSFQVLTNIEYVMQYKVQENTKAFLSQ